MLPDYTEQTAVDLKDKLVHFLIIRLDGLKDISIIVFVYLNILICL